MEAVRRAALELFDSLPEPVRDVCNRAPIDFVMLATEYWWHNRDEDLLLRMAESMEESMLARERYFIDTELAKTCTPVRPGDKR